MTKRRIAVLGGGLGGMSAVSGLTSTPGWDEKYEISVHQIGWRLGGKAASGRGPNGRIQEHGLHILLGFYENAFRMLRDVYDEVKDEDGVFPSFDAAFTGQSRIGLMDAYEGAWSPFLFDFPVNPGRPGDGAPRHYDDVWELLTAGVDEMGRWLERAIGEHAGSVKDAHGAFGGVFDWARHLGHALEEEAAHVARGGILRLLHWTMKRTPRLGAHKPHHHAILGRVIDVLWADIRRLLETSPIVDVRRAALIADMGLAILKGVMDNAARIDAHGLNALDDLDFQDWLKTYGASPLAAEVKTSAPVRALYDLSFAFEDGDVNRPNFAAGNCLRALFCLGMLYKGSVFHKMNAGMGDTIFTPFYKAFTGKGVRVHFFHRVTDIRLGTVDGVRVVEEVDIAVQVRTPHGYDPFVRVGQLDCWPQAPRVEQIERGAALCAGPDGDGVDGWDGDWKGYNLENPWSGWVDADTLTLRRGTDFDDVILAIPPMAHRLIAGAAVEEIPQWARMVDEVKSVRTQAVQLWFKPDLEGLGWTEGSTVVDAFVDPLNTWADMSHLLPREDWPDGEAPRNIAYMCGPMKGGLPDGEDGDPLGAARAEAAANAEGWLSHAPGWLWPSVSEGGALDPAALDDASPGGAGRLKGQYWRANIFPSEFYVLSTAGSNAARIDAAGLPVRNLFLAGDWTDNGFNGGCVEAAVISGLRASNAIAGWPRLEDVESYW